MKPDEFIAVVAPIAQQSMKRTGIPASFTIAQAALESGWGTSKTTVNARNLFNVKADKAWKGPTWDMPSTEHVAGKDVVQPAKWRSYPDWLSCIEDHASFLLTNPRYKPAFACSGDCAAFARAVAAAGYATDPNYVTKIMAVVKSHNLIQYDKV